MNLFRKQVPWITIHCILLFGTFVVAGMGIAARTFVYIKISFFITGKTPSPFGSCEDMLSLIAGVYGPLARMIPISLIDWDQLMAAAKKMLASYRR